MSALNYLKDVFGRKRQAMYQAWLMDSQAIFSSFGKDIYLSDFVNNAIDRVASEISKIEVKSIVQSGDSLQVQNDDMTRLFRFKPNPLQTTSDFLASVEWLRRKNRNAFIYPQYETIRTGDRLIKRYTALYPLNPAAVHIGAIEGQVWEIQFNFADGSSYTIPYADLIHLRWRRGANLIIGGGNDEGQANDYDMIRTIDALDKTIQGLPKSIEASLQIKGVYTAKTVADQDRLSKMRDNLESHIIASKSGIIATDLGGDFTPVRISAPEISDTALQFLKSVIQEKYGVSAAILSGDYSGEQHAAFYQTAIEEFIVQFEQAMTACLYTNREHDVGHRVKCYYSKVNYLDTADKFNLATLAKETGLMTLNQLAEMYGFEPFEGGDRRLQSLNYVNIQDIDAYQKGKAGVAAENEVVQDGAVDVGEAEDVTQEVAGKTLNGIQTQSLLTVMEQYAAGSLTTGQAINIIAISIGVSKQEAKEIIEGLE